MENKICSCCKQQNAVYKVGIIYQRPIYCRKENIPIICFTREMEGKCFLCKSCFEKLRKRDRYVINSKEKENVQIL